MKIEKIITLIVAIAIIGTVVYIGVRFVTGLVSRNNISSVSAQDLQKTYTEVIATETDVNKLTEQGATLIKGNQIDNGIVSLQRATVIEPKYRDAWVWLGYAQIKNNQPQNAITSLNKAAEIDPIYPDTFKYLTLAYEQTDDSASAKTAQEKYDFLTKTK